jgi:hypothetical protein
MMRDGDERRLRDFENGAAADQTQADATEDDRTRFSSHGALPPVAADDMVLKPTASDLAYADEDVALAPPKPAGDTKPANAAPANANAAWPQLLTDFAAKFPDAANLIAASPTACRFVKAADAAGAKFGGFAEDGVGHSAWAYTIHETVYIPKAHTDAIQAMSDFLFELNNATRMTKFNALRDEAKKGSKGSLTAQTYARKTVELEVEGMLQLGEVWVAAKKEAGKEKDKAWAAHDSQFYLAQYQAYKAGKVTKDDIIDAVLKSKYTEGADAGKTVEQFYMDQYEAHVQRGEEERKHP